jgi:hypothetical protein
MLNNLKIIFVVSVAFGLSCSVICLGEENNLAEYTLDAPPLWDSMVVVKGTLLLCTSDGQLRCFVREK